MATPIDPAASPWWAAFTASLAAQGLAVAPEVFPAATDASYLRVLGIPAIGFSPLRDTPRLLHDHDEHIGVATYAEAVAVYTRLVADLAGAPAWPGEPRRRQQAGSTAAEEGHGDEL